MELIIQQVLLEQFIAYLMTGIAEWIQCHRPESLDKAIHLAEEHQV